MKTVYADVLFCINFFIDFALLSVSAFILKIRVKGIRLVLSAALGGVYSVLIFLPELSFLSSLGIKLLFSALLCFAAFGFGRITGYLKRLAVFYAVSLGFGGVVFGAYSFLKPDKIQVRNSAVYIDVKPFYLFLLIAAAYAAVWVFYRILPKKTEELYMLSIFVGGKCAEISALYDSGNMLSDPISGTTVILVELSAVEKLIPKSVRKAFYHPSKPYKEAAVWGHSFRLIPARGAFGSEQLLPAFRPDNLTVRVGNKSCLSESIFVAVTTSSLSSDGRYRALIGSDVIKNLTELNGGAA